MEYLDFEMPIKELQDQLEKCQIIGEESDEKIMIPSKKRFSSGKIVVKGARENNLKNF